MRLSRLAIAAALAMPLLVGGTAQAQTKTDPAKPADPAKPGDPAKPSLSDAEIASMAKLHHANGMEIDMGKLGSEKAKGAVKSYAAKMIKDHKKADDKLMALAKKKNATLTVPAPTDAEKKEMDEQMSTAARLRSLEGAEFEREFMAAMVKDHTSALALVTDAQSKANDKDVVALFKSARTMIESHKTAAEKLAAKQAGADKSKTPSTAAPK
jgi:putative membrane protein